MSRSCRHTLIFPVTCATSDKEFKTREHKRMRRRFNIKLVVRDFDIVDVPGRQEFGNPWRSDKEGRVFYCGASKKATSK